MLPISQRTKKARESLGLSKTAFAERMMYDRNYIAAVEEGKREPGPRFVRQLGILEAEIESGLVGDPAAHTIVHPEKEPLKVQRVALPVGMGKSDTFKQGKLPARRVPIVSRAQAGLLGEWDEFPAEWQETLLTDCPDPQAFAFELDGESMEPLYRSGDIVVVMPSYRPYNESLVVAKLTNGDVMFKRLVFLDLKGERLQLVSYNPLYPPREVTVEDLQSIHPVWAATRRVFNMARWKAEHEARN